MKFFDVEPRSRAWFDHRIGLCTSSNFHKILTSKTLKVSSQAPKYMAELIAERITGEQTEGYQSEWMVRGQDVEDSIWRSYEVYTDAETSRGGFFTNDAGTIGCSPDRLVGADGIVECKAPMLTTQILYILAEGPDDDYKVQCQGQLMVSERDWVDVFSWHPQLFLPPIRIYRDEKFIAILRPVLDRFIETLLACWERLDREYGPFARPEPAAAQEDYDALGVTEDDVNAILAAQAERGAQ